MELLKAVNSILPKLGEHPVTSVDIKHPTLAVILPQLDETRRSVLIDGWWFNQFNTTLYPDSEGGIAVPADTLSFVPCGRVRTVVRGGQLFNPTDLSFKFAAPVDGTIVLDVPFNELPESAALWILYTSLVIVYATDIGLEEVVQLWRGEEMKAQALFEREFMRQMKFTTKSSKRWGNLQRALRG